MNLKITCTDDSEWAISEFDANTLLDLREDLDNSENLFVQFDMDGEPVLLNKLQIVSIEIT